MSRDAGDCLGVPGGNQPLHIQGYESGEPYGRHASFADKEPTC